MTTLQISLYFYGLFITLDESGESFDGSFEIAPDGTFPNGRNAVTQQRKLPTRLDIAHYVVRKLVIPKTAVRFRATRHFTAVLVPKTSIYKYDYIVLQDEQVG